MCLAIEASVVIKVGVAFVLLGVAMHEVIGIAVVENEEVVIVVVVLRQR